MTNNDKNNTGNIDFNFINPLFLRIALIIQSLMGSKIMNIIKNMLKRDKNIYDSDID